MPRLAVVMLFMLLVFPAVGHLQPTCDAPPLSDAEVKSAIDRARATRTDLLAPFPEYRSSVKKRGCYYVYIEYRLPEAPDSNHIITLNQHGAIVDMQAGRSSFKLQCPARCLRKMSWRRCYTPSGENGAICRLRSKTIGRGSIGCGVCISISNTMYRNSEAIIRYSQSTRLGN